MSIQLLERKITVATDQQMEQVQRMREDGPKRIPDAAREGIAAKGVMIVDLEDDVRDIFTKVPSLISVPYISNNPSVDLVVSQVGFKPDAPSKKLLNGSPERVGEYFDKMNKGLDAKGIRVVSATPALLGRLPDDALKHLATTLGDTVIETPLRVPGPSGDLFTVQFGMNEDTPVMKIGVAYSGKLSGQVLPLVIPA